MFTQLITPLRAHSWSPFPVHAEVAWQVPFTHTLVAQRLPRAPQFAESLCRSTQAVPVSVSPGRQVHVPAAQLWSERHERPTEPQLFGSN